MRNMDNKNPRVPGYLIYVEEPSSPQPNSTLWYCGAFGEIYSGRGRWQRLVAGLWGCSRCRTESVPDVSTPECLQPGPWSQPRTGGCHFIMSGRKQ